MTSFFIAFGLGLEGIGFLTWDGSVKGIVKGWLYYKWGFRL